MCKVSIKHIQAKIIFTKNKTKQNIIFLGPRRSQQGNNILSYHLFPTCHWKFQPL